MPDLIIKPTNTSGNKVIIQDQAGGAVLTTADSGATFSGGNIGTVTAGNLANTAIVYPAGHVIQTVSDEYSPTGGSNIGTGSLRVLGTDLEVPITCASTSNKLRVSCFLSALYNQGTASRQIQCGFAYSTDDWSSESILGSKKYVGSHWGHYGATPTVYLIVNISFEIMVAVPTASAMKIQVTTTAATGDCTLFQNASATQQLGELIVQEIQG